tara:strand:- start:2784 stop:2990 length:207 start_codon:yes stop_codon:yes gene_type:complete
MEELVNLIANDASAAEISDGIKDTLFAKAASRIDAQKANVALSMFDGVSNEEQETDIEEPEEETTEEE